MMSVGPRRVGCLRMVPFSAAIPAIINLYAGKVDFGPCFLKTWVWLADPSSPSGLWRGVLYGPGNDVRQPYFCFQISDFLKHITEIKKQVTIRRSSPQLLHCGTLSHGGASTVALIVSLAVRSLLFPLPMVYIFISWGEYNNLCWKYFIL